MANCILAAAFTTCCGSLRTGSRLQVFNSLLAICKSCGLPPTRSEDRENLLTLEQYPKFMIGQVTIDICKCETKPSMYTYWCVWAGGFPYIWDCWIFWTVMYSISKCSSCTIVFQPALYQLLIEGLPPDATSTENACLITHDHSQSWPLIVDRSGLVEAWLKCRLTNPVILKYKV